MMIKFLIALVLGYIFGRALGALKAQVEPPRYTVED